jgi:Domain of unknown function (DUF4062)
VQAVFISSIQRGFEAVRAAVRRAVESLGMRPLMAELAGARPESPQRALLDLVAQADVFLLVIGPHYSAPTEEEFNEANRRGKPILVLRQEVELDPEQAAFLERVAGGWQGGRLWGTFTDASDVGFAAVQALSGLGSEQRSGRLGPAAQERAQALAGGERTQSFGVQRAGARVALAPLVGSPLLDALALDDALGEAVADLARAARLVPHSVGIEPRVSGQGVTLQRAASGYVGEAGPISVGTDGAVAVEIDIGGSDPPAGTRIDPALLGRGIQSAGSFALDVWARIDPREEVQQVAVAVAILDAQTKVFGLPPHASTYTMGHSLPATVVVPNPPVVVRRGEVSGDQLAARLVAEVRRVYADAGAIAS